MKTHTWSIITNLLKLARTRTSVGKVALILCSGFCLALIVGSEVTSTSPNQKPDGSMQSFPAEQLSQITVISPTDTIWEMIGQVNRSRAVSDLRRLAGEEPICTSTGCSTATDRQTGGVGLHRAMDYFYQELTRLGYSAEFMYWSREGWNDRNLIAKKAGISAPGEEIYLVAHVDGVKLNEEEQFPAADDNASGAVDVLEVARVLSTHSFSRTVVFLFSTGEEHGALGVRSYVDQLTNQQLSRIKDVIDVDMVGYDADRDGAMQLWPGDDPAALVLTQMMSETIAAYRLDLAPRIRVGCA